MDVIATVGPEMSEKIRAGMEAARIRKLERLVKEGGPKTELYKAQLEALS